MINNIIKPKRPEGKWNYAGSQTELGFESHYWRYEKLGILARSALEVATEKDGSTNGPEFHISFSKTGMKRCSTNEIKFCLIAFQIEGAIEDNHVPGGFVRNFWMPVNKNIIGKHCKCEKEENKIIEDNGEYVWRT